MPDAARAPEPASFAALVAPLAAAGGDDDFLAAPVALGTAFSPALAAPLGGVLAAALLERGAPGGAFLAPRAGAVFCDEPTLRPASGRGAGRRAGAAEAFFDAAARLAGAEGAEALEDDLGPALPAADDLLAAGFGVDFAVAFFDDRAAVRSERAVAFFAAVTPTSSKTSPRGVRPAGRR